MPVVRLTEIFRQAAAEPDRHQRPPDQPGRDAVFLKGKARRTVTDFYFVEADEPEERRSQLLQAGDRAHPEAVRLRPLDDIQVLTPMHRGVLGLPQPEPGAAGGCSTPTGLPVAEVRLDLPRRRQGDADGNNYDKDVFNGDIGRDRRDRRGRAGAARPLRRARRSTYDFSELDELVLAYACTIHKSQGSEYPAVVIPVHTQHYMLLQRNLLYTAITRAGSWWCWSARQGHRHRGQTGGIRQAHHHAQGAPSWKCAVHASH